MCNLVFWSEQNSYRGKKEFTIIKEEEKNKPKPEPTMEDKLQIRKEYLETCFIKPYKKYIATGLNTFSPQDCTRFFTMLWLRKLVEPSAEEKERYRKRALEYFETNARKLTDSRKEMQDLINKLELFETDKSIQAKVKSKAAEYFFLDWCKQFSNCDVDIEEFLKENEFYKVN